MYEDGNPKVISKAIKRAIVDPGHQGQNTDLTPEQEVEMSSWIEQKSVRNEYVGRRVICNYVQPKYNPTPTKRWVNDLFLRHQAALCRNTSHPQELSHLQVPHLFLERTIGNIKQYVHGQAFELISNLEEGGCSD
jgi:hypothetical protein